MKELLDEAPCAFLSVDDDGVILATNQTLLRMTGYELGELDRQPLHRLFSTGARIFYQTHFFPLLKMKGEVEEIYLSLRSKFGEEIPTLVNARRTTRNGGAVNDCVFVRMRQRAVFEDELLKAKKAAQQANKAKDAFLAALSHELRNPLNPVLMLSTAMEMDPGLPAEIRENAAVIRRNAELEARLIDDLLDLTRITHGKLKLVATKVDLHAVLSQTEEIVKSDGQGKRVPIRFIKEAAEHHVLADGARLQQVFWNLVKNAIKFTPSGGDIQIITNNEKEGRVLVKVIDTGMGIEADALPRIFDAFDQGRASTQQFGGLGLGLAISKAIVLMHGGVIHAESPGNGQGATFFVELATCSPPDPSGAGTQTILASRKKLRLLLVEDHDSTRDVLTAILRRAGHEVHPAGTVADALALAASSGPFHVLISDLGLPDQSGFALMRTIKRKYGLPGIALSGYGMDEDVRQALEAGFSAHLVKPISLEQLHVHLQQLTSGA